MKFYNREHAGQLLAKELEHLKNENVVVYAMPRGGVVVANEIAKFLEAPLDLIITRKIGHPYSPEYAVAAIAEDGHMMGVEEELAQIDPDWLENEINAQRKEAKRRRKKYLANKKIIDAKDKIAVLVDDGVATGLTLRIAILELQHRHPKKIIVAVPVVPKSIGEIIRGEVDEMIALDIPTDYEYLGAVGAYYDYFEQVEDEKVIEIIQNQ